MKQDADFKKSEKQPGKQTELLDVDAVKSCASYHTKPRQNTALLWRGFIQIFFYPIFPGLWITQSSLLEFVVRSTVYFSQAALLTCYVFSALPGFGKQDVTEMLQVELWMPVVLLALGAFGYGRVVSAKGLPPEEIPEQGMSGEDIPDEWASDHEPDTEEEEEEEEEDLEEDLINDARLRPASGPHRLVRVASDEVPMPMAGHNPQKNSHSLLSSPSTDSDTPWGDKDRTLGARRSLPFPIHWSDFVRTRKCPDQNSVDAGRLWGEQDTEERIQWGVGDQTMVKVILWESNTCSKVPMSLTQLRTKITEQADRYQQRGLHRTAPFIGATVAAVLPLCFHVLKFLGMLFACSDWFAFPFKKLVNEGVVWGFLHTFDIDQFSVLGDVSLNNTVPVCFSLDSPLVLMPVLPTAFGIYCIMLSITSSIAVFLVSYGILHQMAQAELTYLRRSMYAKFFSAVTSSKKAKKYKIPHFSLKNVVNIKIWLALRGGRAWLKKHHLQRCSDATVSSTFILCIIALSMTGFEVFSKEGRFLTALVHWELLAWTGLASLYLLRYLTHGARINRRYTDTSVLLTEQINVQLRLLRLSELMAQAVSTADTHQQNRLKEKRERLLVSNNILKLAAKLLKELGSPHKISGLSMDPVVYNVARVVLVSALSAITSEMLGFKLKIWKLLKFK